MMTAVLRVCLLTPGTPASGSPLLEHARRLGASHGHEVTIALTEERLPGGATDLEGARLVDADAVTVRDTPFDAAVASGWTATAHLFAVTASRYVSLVRTLEHERMGTWQAERFAAALSYDLPVDFVVTAAWLSDAFAELRPDARTVLVPDGLDRAVFAPGEGGGAAGSSGSTVGALRVVVDDLQAADRASSPERGALQAATAQLDATFIEPGDDAAARAAKLRDADVVLHLPAGDGVLGTPLEGFACGATAVVTPARDQPEVVEHDVTGLIAEHDDVRGAAGHLDRLAGDAELLTRLRDAARAKAAERPSWDDATAKLHDALEHLVAEPPPEEVRWPVRLMSDAIAGSAVLKQELAVVGEELNRLRGDDLYRAAQRVRGRWEQVDGPARPLAERVLARARARLLR